MDEETEKALLRIKEALARDRMARVISFPIAQTKAKSMVGNQSAKVLSLSDHRKTVGDQSNSEDQR